MPGPEQSKEIVEELKQLRRGRGVNADSLSSRVGTGLSRLAGLSAELSQARYRTTLSTYLSSVSQELPSDLRVCVDAALGLEPLAEGENLQRRLKWAEQKIDRDQRTVIRRVDRGFALMVEKMLEADRGVVSWYVERFEAVLRMDRTGPEAVEDRIVVVTAGELTELLVATTVPRHPDDELNTHQLEYTVLDGGELRWEESKSERNFRAMLVLPEPLYPGQRHRYRIRARIPVGQRMHPHYVYVPGARCDEFALTVHFDPDELPPLVYKLSGEPAWQIEEPLVRKEKAVPDESGTVSVEFGQLETGLGYGLNWDERAG